jgi:two-component system, NarL family, response regulator DevR
VKTLRVLLVDDHELVRMGLRTLLEGIEGITVVAEAGSGAAAIEYAGSYQPDVVIMDIRMPGINGIEACQAITSQWPDIQVIVLTSFADDQLIGDAIQAGAVGYVLKQVGSDELVRALDAVRHDAALLDPSVTRRVLALMRQKERPQVDPFGDLTDREIEVLRELASGKNNVQIAESLFLSEKTVRNHISIVLNKLGVNNRVEAATLAVHHQIETYRRE